VAKRAPTGLGKEGRALWRSVIDDVASRGTDELDCELDPRELKLLEHACRVEDRIVALQELVDKQGLRVRGSKGQQVLNPAIAEIRQQQIVQQRLLGQIGLDVGTGEKTGAASNRARHAAQARWSRRDDEGGAQLRVVDGGAGS